MVRVNESWLLVYHGNDYKCVCVLRKDTRPLLTLPYHCCAMPLREHLRSRFGPAESGTTDVKHEQQSGANEVGGGGGGGGAGENQKGERFGAKGGGGGGVRGQAGINTPHPPRPL